MGLIALPDETVEGLWRKYLWKDEKAGPPRRPTVAMHNEQRGFTFHGHRRFRLYREVDQSAVSLSNDECPPASSFSKYLKCDAPTGASTGRET